MERKSHWFINGIERRAAVGLIEAVKHTQARWMPRLKSRT